MRRWLCLTGGVILSALAVAWQLPFSASQNPPAPARELNATPSAVAGQTLPAPSPRSQPWFVDDERFYQQFLERLTALAEKGECLPTEQLRRQWQRAGKVAVKGLGAPPSATPRLTPEEVYQRALPAVFVLGSIYKEDDGEWTDGMYATAWAISAEGILVTNWHVFEDVQETERFGACDHRGRVYPVVEILGGDPAVDVAFVRIAARELTPLPLSRDYAPVGSWVGVLGHPGDNFYVFTTGTVTRYSTNRNEDGRQERWMGLTADYAGGSSGSPVLDTRGAVVGMAALTLTLEDAGTSRRRRATATGRRGDPEDCPLRFLPPRPLSLRNPPFHRSRSEGKPKVPGDSPEGKPKVPDEPSPGKPKPPDAPPQPPAVQMILKMAVPAPDIARLLIEP